MYDVWTENKQKPNKRLMCLVNIWGFSLLVVLFEWCILMARHMMDGFCGRLLFSVCSKIVFFIPNLAVEEESLSEARYANFIHVSDITFVLVCHPKSSILVFGQCRFSLQISSVKSKFWIRNNGGVAAFCRCTLELINTLK